MAITPMTVIAQTGQSPLTIRVIENGTDTISATESATEAANGDGLYNFTVTGLTGRFRFHVFTAAGALLGVWYADLVDTTDPVDCKDLALSELVVSVDDDVYHADIDLTYDDADSTDKYTVTWFKNAVPITSGITVPTIEVFKQSDGSTLISSTPVADVGNGNFKYNEMVNRMPSGDAGIALATATIDGQSRSFKDNVGRDNTA